MIIDGHPFGDGLQGCNGSKKPFFHLCEDAAPHLVLNPEVAGVKSEFFSVHSEKGHDLFRIEPGLYSDAIRNMLEK